MAIRLTKKQKAQVLNAEDLYQIMQRILVRQGKIRGKQEHLWLVGLQTNNSIDFIGLLTIGSLNSLYIVPRELFRIAVLKNVPKFILVHNHPTGNVAPFKADKAFTKSQSQAADLLGVKIIDHLIISAETYFSFAEKNLI